MSELLISSASSSECILCWHWPSDLLSGVDNEKL